MNLPREALPESLVIYTKVIAREACCSGLETAVSQIVSVSSTVCNNGATHPPEYSVERESLVCLSPVASKSWIIVNSVSCRGGGTPRFIFLHLYTFVLKGFDHVIFISRDPPVSGSTNTQTGLPNHWLRWNRISSTVTIIFNLVDSSSTIMNAWYLALHEHT